MKSTFKLFTIGGIEIGVHFTWLFAFALITWSLARGLYPESFPRWSETEYWVAGAATSLVLFASVLVHELAHSFMALRQRMPVKGITLFIFGGVSNIGGDARKPGEEFLVAIVGPATSVLISAMFYFLWYGISDTKSRDLPWLNGASSPVEGVIFYSAFVNLSVAVFNMVPGFPLDGGRVLRSMIWGITGSMRRATVIAANIGRFVGWCLMAFGLYRALNDDPIGGIWMMMIGWFLASAATSAMRDQTQERQLAGATVRDAMQPEPISVSPDMPVEELVNEVFIRRGIRAAPVVSDGVLLGIVSISDVRRVSTVNPAEANVASIMTRGSLHTVGRGDSLDFTLKLLVEKNINQAVVLDGGRVVGLISRDNLMRYVQLVPFRG